MRRFHALRLLLAGGLLALTALPAAADPVAVDVISTDGLLLRGTYYGAAEPGPGVLLLHQCNRDRTSWDDLAAAMSDAGLHVLALDFRGFGESVNESNRSFSQQGDQLWPRFTDDVDRAFEFLATMPDVNGERIGVLGASCGGSQGLLLAARQPAVRALAFLSSSAPWIEETEIQAFEANRTDIPFLGIGAEGDADSAKIAERLYRSSPHEQSRLILYKGVRHGVPLFDLDTALPDVIVAWFLDTL